MLCPWTYEICLSALESVATEIKRYKSGIGIGMMLDATHMLIHLLTVEALPFCYSGGLHFIISAGN